MESLYRTFVAFDIVPNNKILATVDELKEKLKSEKIRWENSSKYHITLSFLGDTTQQQITTVKEVLTNVIKNFECFDIVVKDFGVFPDLRRPRVIWLGIEAPNTLKELQKQIGSEISRIGFELDNREFKPHLTIARINFLGNKKILDDFAKKYQNIIFSNQKIKQIVYYQSILTPNGSIYKPLASFDLI